MNAAPPLDRVWTWLADVPDPEIPAVSVVDLGVVRDVAWERAGEGDVLAVAITPTYSGCPAMTAIARDIERTLRERGVPRVRLDVRLAPPWTTDWMTDAAREKLRAYGIAPPRERAPQAGLDGIAHAPLVACPRCATTAVSLVSWFGSTPCKALYRCDACAEPFDYFKCH